MKSKTNRRPSRVAETVAEQIPSKSSINTKLVRLPAMRAFEQAAIGMAIIGLDGKWMRVNGALCDILGVSEQEMLATDFQTFTHPEDLPRNLEMAQQLLQGKVRRSETEKRYRHKAGHYVWVSVSSSLIYGKGGKPLFYFTQIQNITERKTAELARLESENRLQLILEGAKDYAIFMLDDTGHIASWNAGAERLKGYRAEEILKKHFSCLYSLEDIDGGVPKESLAVASAVGRYESEGWRVRKDGSRFMGNIVISALRDASGNLLGFVKVVRDVSERRQLEHQLRLAQRMEAIGQLAGGVAHDFNNLLSVILGYGDILLERAGNDVQTRHHCEEILKAGNRAASLTRQLLAYSRQQVLQPKVLDLNGVVREIEKMLRRLIGEDIELYTFLDPTLGTVKADPGQLERIIINLAVNARDAMAEGGRLTIHTTQMTADAEYARLHRPMYPGNYVVLDITDTGCGMDTETQSHIFEPFFTTKEPGKGTGLGLATVYGVVKQSGGYIWVYSEEGVGTTFKIYLPRVDEPVSLSAPVEETPEFPQRGETVLLVEDDQSIRRLTRTLLEQGGFNVLEAGRGDEAIEIAFRHDGPIHLLLTDIIMPGMKGTELAKRLIEVRPEVKAIYMSGYTGFRRHEVLGQEAILLAKPFTRDALLQKLHEALMVDSGALTK